MSIQEKFVHPAALRVAVAGVKKYVDDNFSRALVSINYSDLVALRDEEKLVPGQQYRIVDYVATTTQENTQSAGHAFDIIVTADDEKNLNAEAHAIQHEGDEYFADSDLNAWQVWYSIDNDITHFAWADPTNGKGVVYRLIDEFNNDVPYDFKNIQFKRWKVAAEKIRDLNGAYYGIIGANQADLTIPDENDFIWCYTFSSELVDGCSDASLVFSNFVHDNKIGDTGMDVNGSIMAHSLSNNVFGGLEVHSNTLGELCHTNTFGNYCDSNTFGNGCGSNTFGNHCDSNTFGNGCESNTFGNYCETNTFGVYCDSNTFGDSCGSNTFGNYCHSNTFGYLCYYNSFGNGCHTNTFGNGCGSNTFGNDCRSNTFGNHCDSNTFGNDCISNTFGNDYMQYINIADGIQYINLKTPQATSSSKHLQNISIHRGVKGTNSSNKLEIDVDVIGQDYEIIYTNDTNGVLKKVTA